MSHQYQCPLRWGDMDAQGHLNNAVYLDYLQEARVDFLLSGPPVTQELLTTGVLVVSHQVEYMQPVAFSETPMTISLWIDAIGASRFAIGYDMFDGDLLAARARTAAVPYDLARNVLRRLLLGEREVLSRHLAPSEPLRPLPRQRWTSGGHRYPLAVRWSDLDSYGHVNNVKYFDYIQEARIALMADTLGWPAGAEAGRAVWVIVRQDLEYLSPIDFRTEPYEVVSVVSAVGQRSFTLAAEIRDPLTASTYAAARTVVVGPERLSDDARQCLQRWSAPEA